jgi:membrane-bound metal-dependent hydrolase YbcI (DUF457 family)
MFVGHYGVSFAAKRVAPTIPLWTLFIAVQLLDVFWAPFILLGIEKVRIVPGITASNPLDLYYMPYTHSLLAALLWSAGALLACRLFAARDLGGKAALVVALAVLSHWLLDFLVHRPDLPLYDNTAKVGLGLWNVPAVAFVLEAALLFGGMWLYLGTGVVPRLRMVVFGLVMLAIQAYVFFGPPPVSDNAAAWTALAAYVVFAVVVARLERPSRVSRRGAA